MQQTSPSARDIRGTVQHSSLSARCISRSALLRLTCGELLCEMSSRAPSPWPSLLHTKADSEEAQQAHGEWQATHPASSVTGRFTICSAFKFCATIFQTSPHFGVLPYSSRSHPLTSLAVDIERSMEEAKVSTFGEQWASFSSS